MNLIKLIKLIIAFIKSHPYVSSVVILFIVSSIILPDDTPSLPPNLPDYYEETAELEPNLPQNLPNDPYGEGVEPEIQVDPLADSDSEIQPDPIVNSDPEPIQQVTPRRRFISSFTYIHIPIIVLGATAAILYSLSRLSQ